MSQNLEKKKELVAEVIDVAKKAKSVVLAEYKGVTVEQATALRNECRKNNVEYLVCKNRLLKRAFEAAGIKISDRFLEGQTSVAFGSDETTAAKILNQIAGTTSLVIKCGFCFGKELSDAEVKELALIPSHQVLAGQLVGMLTMPMRAFAVTLDQIAQSKK